MMSSSVQVWDEFLKRYYWENILELAGDYPGRRSLLIQFSDLERFDMELGYELLESPDTVLRHANEALRAVNLPANIEFEDTHIQIINVPEQVRVQVGDIRSGHINKFIAVSGLVRKATEVRPQIILAAFRCQRCEHVTIVPQETGRFIEPYTCDNDVCGRKGPFKLVHEKSEFADMQKIRIQDSPDELRGGQQPQTLDIDVSDDLTGLVSPGDRVLVTGILRSYQRNTQHGKSTVFDLVLDAVSLQIEEKGFEEIEISDADEAAIIQLSEDPDIYNKIVASIAPSIYGYSEVKEAIALQLFSGLPKVLPDALRVRGDIHVLLVGDPGVAKSQLLRYTRKLAPRGVLTSGKSSTAAGLTATATKDDLDNKWTLEAGALVLADMGIACIDELDKMEAKDRSSMHEAAEQQTISISKAGINTTLKSRCAILGAANPKYGRFDRYEPVAKQINMEPPLLSRFDLIFIISDDPKPEKDAAVSNHIFNVHIAGELLLQRQNIHNSGITDEEIAGAVESIKPAIESELLRKYIAYSKKKVFPRITPDARKQLNDFYLNLRKQGAQPDSPIPVTARNLEALIRLAEASARARLSNIVTVDDSTRVVRIVMASLNQTIIDPETGKLDADLINTGMGKSQRDKIRILRQIIQELQGNGAVPVSEILAKASDLGIKKETAEDMLLKLKTIGELLEVSEGRYRVV